MKQFFHSGRWPSKWYYGWRGFSEFRKLESDLLHLQDCIDHPCYEDYQEKKGPWNSFKLVDDKIRWLCMGLTVVMEEKPRILGMNHWIGQVVIALQKVDKALSFWTIEFLRKLGRMVEEDPLVWTSVVLNCRVLRLSS